MMAAGGNGGACSLRQRHLRSAGPAVALEDGIAAAMKALGKTLEFRVV